MQLRIAFVLTVTLLPLSAETTFTRDVAPILYRHCAGCHHANDIAPMPLITYKDARPWAAAMKQAVVTRQMPPWKADPRFGKWVNDASLSDAEIATVKAWVDGGSPEGDPKWLPKPPVFVDGWRIGQPDAIIAIPKQTISSQGPDEYVYINVPTSFTEDKWVTVAELRAGNRRVVHHAHVSVVEPEKTSAAKPVTTAPDATESYVKSLIVHEGSLEWVRPDAPVINDGCAVDDNGLFPGHKSSDLGHMIASYLPGRSPDVFPAGTARLVPAGSKLNFQIHYSHTSGKTEFDETSVGFIFAKEPPKQIAHRIDLSNTMFRVPAGAPEQEVSECHTFTKDVYITSLTPHMHLRGKAMQIVAIYPDGRRETLLSVPKYDFNWQITYRAAAPLFIPGGTRIAVIGHFDNSPNNPRNPDATKPVRWGAASETEMMDGWIEYVDAGAPGTTTARLQ